MYKSWIVFNFTMIFTMVFFAIGNAQDKGFIHTATAANIHLHGTYIDNPELNGNPSTYFLFSQRYNGSGNNNPTGVVYDGSEAKWLILNENLEAMPEGIQFNIYIPDDSPVERVVSDVTNTVGHIMALDGYAESDYVFQNTSYNPNSVFNTGIYGTYWHDGVRRIYEESSTAIPDGAAFMVMQGLSTSAILGSETSSVSNISGNYMTIDHALLNNNPGAVFIFNHYWGYPDASNQVYLPYITEVEYNFSIDRWAVYKYGSGDFPEGVTIDYIIPNEILETNDVAAELNKVSLYPNPVVNLLNIQSKKEVKSVEIFDMIGQKVKTITNFTSSTNSVNISNLASGMYVTKIITVDGRVTTQKFMKK